MPSVTLAASVRAAALLACARGGLGAAPECDAQREADALNRLYLEDDDGVFMRSVGMGFVKPWRFCENHTYPAAYCEKVYSSGRSSFQIINKNAWNATEQAIKLFFGTPQSGESNKGFVAAPSARSSVICGFAQDGWTGGRVNNGCGCNFLCGWQVLKGCNPWWCHKSQWCEEGTKPQDSGGKCGCAYRGGDLSKLLHDTRQTMADNYNEIIVDAKLWNSQIPANIEAFYLRKSKCGPGTDCYTDFLRMYHDFEQEHGCKAVVLLDEHREHAPFEPHAGPVPGPPPSPAPVDEPRAPAAIAV